MQKGPGLSPRGRFHCPLSQPGASRQEGFECCALGENRFGKDNQLTPEGLFHFLIFAG